MARKTKNYVVSEKNKTIKAVFAKLTEEEVKEIKVYQEVFGYSLIAVSEIKRGKSVDEIRAELKEKDEEALNEFNRLYALKVPKDMSKDEAKKIGFHGAMKYYADWKKKNK